MCSIVAYKGKFDAALILDIFKYSRIRGLHSFGYSYVSGNNIVTKKFLSYDDFCATIQIDSPDAFIAHFRYSTSGDYKLHVNNQPIVKKNVAMVFNGVIDMRTKQQMENAYCLEMETDNDGEIALLERIKGKESVLKFIANKTFAGAFLHEDETIEILRNNKRPCHIGRHMNAKIVASTKDILNRAGIDVTSIVDENKLVAL
jgi:glutamine phosphoribosylpyrophosphate amidotransferase